MNDHHALRLQGLLDNAIAKGAEVLSSGSADGRGFPPTLIASLTPEMLISNEEIFGPILPIIAYDDLDDVIAAINARPKPLALYVSDRKTDFIDHVLAQTSSGSVGVNLAMAQFSHLGLPFGGVNGSGIGAAHGRAGFDAFSHQRAVLRTIASPLPLLFPPYTARVRRLIDSVTRILG